MTKQLHMVPMLPGEAADQVGSAIVIPHPRRAGTA